MGLSYDHERSLLEESGITPEVIAGRGYETITTKAGLERLGFTKAQQSVPALKIPIHRPDGEVAFHQIRPDDPRYKDGKKLKYEVPRGVRTALDVHPFAREMLGDPGVPLFITEGVKKGDALVSRGLAAVALLGVWNWRGTNRHGGKTVLPEWESVALNGREVFIVFDSDIVLKPDVYRAMLRLKAWLEGR